MTASYQITVNNHVTKGYPLTLTQKHVFWKIPESSLHHVEVAAAHTVHECRQEVCRQAAEEKANHYVVKSKWKQKCADK